MSALAAAGLLLGALFFINAEAGFIGCTVTSRFGWIAPLAAASILGGVTWVLLGQRRPGDDATTPFDGALCPACGREVLGQWRMCPYCGEMLATRSERHASASSVVE